MPVFRIFKQKIISIKVVAIRSALPRYSMPLSEWVWGRSQ
ncbi:hypothetical protein NEICINOT_04893 [Neisseria cinerea ATCC 14685]|uniref:Uncharacterized protein n=1 Tax=Neisseria cinerea ATCC 14685 TaxID=546262 RepID=D0W5D8_NEICI|nr:hypothetical protein NEICINOT_04893 [Neisseria cinerea ATCC 14685]